MSSTDSVAANIAPAPNNASSGGATAAAAAMAASAGASNAAGDTGRSLVVDEKFFEEQFLRCQVCHERFDQSERSPKSLPCNHTFCLPCLTQIFDHAQPPARRTLLWADETLDGTLKCPTCRVEIFLSRNKIKELPNDHRVVQMMDFLSQAVAKSQNVCTKHDRQPLNFFCKKCLVPVCRDCTVLDHKESDGHAIIDVSEALSENSAAFSDIEKKSKDTLEKMKARSDCLANASKRLDILERRLKGEIKETFIEYRLLLEKRQEYLTSMVHQIIQDQKAKINARFVNVCEHGTQLQKLYDDFKSSKNSNDIRKLFTINQQMKDHETQFTEVASQDDNELFQSCEFEAQNEGSFLSDMSGLGEVRAKPDLELKEPISAQQLVILDMEEQRERQRLLDSQLGSYGSYGDCDDYLGNGVTPEALMNRYDSDEVEVPEEDDEETPQDHWPDHNALMSRLISYYARQRHHDDEAMDHSESAPSVGNRRSLPRRGRRSRDTNSSGVSSSLTPDRHEDMEILSRLRAARTTASGSSSSPSSTDARASGRNRSSGSSRYRVERHSSGSSLRQPSFSMGEGD